MRRIVTVNLTAVMLKLNSLTGSKRAGMYDVSRFATLRNAAGTS
jgi:hypothetical protein